MFTFRKKQNNPHDNNINASQNGNKNFEQPAKPPLVNPIHRQVDQVLKGVKMLFVEDAQNNLDFLTSLVSSPDLVSETISNF